jgi:hypothetical protein
MFAVRCNDVAYDRHRISGHCLLDRVDELLVRRDCEIGADDFGGKNRVKRPDGQAHASSPSAHRADAAMIFVVASKTLLVNGLSTLATLWLVAVEIIMHVVHAAFSSRDRLELLDP